MTGLNEDLRARLESVLGTAIASSSMVRGGDINEARRLTLTDGSRVFLKTHPRPPRGMFAAEARGLRALRRGPLRVPEVLAQDETFILMSDLGSGAPLPDHDEVLGRGLAAMHSLGANVAGACDDQNEAFIATLPLDNSPSEDWPRFYGEQRLLPLLSGVAIDNSLRRRVESLLPRLSHLLQGASLALLHGDLWRGNVHTDDQGAPCLVDPSAYLGDPEVDLAMMHLFGGFGPRVFEAYDESLPPLAGREQRRVVYQLFPVMVHMVLFGESYLPQLRSLLDACT